MAPAWCRISIATLVILVVSSVRGSLQAAHVRDSHRDQGTRHVEAVQGLKRVVVVYRHGDRATLYSYPTDPYGTSIWPEGLGALTKRGVRQHYQLGKFLAKRYHTFLQWLNGSTSQISVLSSATTRTVKSAQADNAGLFPPTSSQVWAQPVDGSDIGQVWQPIPVFSIPTEQDYLFANAPCPLYRQVAFQFPDRSGYQKRYENIARHIENHTAPMKFPWPSDAWYNLSDIFYTQSQNAFQLPGWVTPNVERVVEFLGNAAFAESVSGSDIRDTYKPRVQGGNLLRVVMEHLNMAANGSTGNSSAKFFAYSGHDNNIAALLVALGQYSFGANSGFGFKTMEGLPNYAACLMFELYQDNTVRIYYRNNKPEGPENDPVVVTHPQCSSACPVDKLTSLTEPYFMTPEQYFESCKIPS